MTKIKAGDTVQRHTGEYKRMGPGDRDVVIAVQPGSSSDAPILVLKKFGGGHASYNFEVWDSAPKEITARDISAFKAGWHAADAEGDEGGRVRRGLESFLAHREKGNA